MAPTAVPPDPTITSSTQISPLSPLKTIDPPLTKQSSTTIDQENLTDNIEDNPISHLRATLASESAPLASRFRALFTLKHHASFHPATPQTFPAIHAIGAPLRTSPSALLKHEVAYCLGQTGHLEAAPILREVLEDREEDAMCRHEAAEALGALGDVGSLDLLKRIMAEEEEEEEEEEGAQEMEADQERNGNGRKEKEREGRRVVRETCEIAIARIEWMVSTSGREAEERDGRLIHKSDFVSVDPAPPVPMLQAGKAFSNGVMMTVDKLSRRLMDPQCSLFERYRAMFALRDLASPPDLPTAIPAIQALSHGLLQEKQSALFRHEIAFVFGQLCHPASISALKECLSRRREVAMVRHEAAEALGSLGEVEGVEGFLRGFLEDQERVVRESVVVALDMAEEGRKFENI